MYVCMNIYIYVNPKIERIKAPGKNLSQTAQLYIQQVHRAKHNSESERQNHRRYTWLTAKSPTNGEFSYV